jgi:hypothetical protein
MQIDWLNQRSHDRAMAYPPNIANLVRCVNLGASRLSDRPLISKIRRKGETGDYCICPPDKGDTGGYCIRPPDKGETGDSCICPPDKGDTGGYCSCPPTRGKEGVIVLVPLTRGIQGVIVLVPLTRGIQGVLCSVPARSPDLASSNAVGSGDPTGTYILITL